MDTSEKDTHNRTESTSQFLNSEPNLTNLSNLPSTTLTVIIFKDDKGYGMKISGDNPVFVQSVKPNGAAERSGLHSGDKIINVNGINVIHSTHTEVVELIKSSTQVELTVQQRPIFINSSNPNLALSPSSSSIMNSTNHITPSRPLQHSHSAPARDRITGPQPIDIEQMRHVELEKWQTFRLMLEKEQKYVDTLNQELQISSEMSNGDRNSKLKKELIGAERRVQILQDQLSTFNEIPLCSNHQSLKAPPLPPRNRTMLSSNIDKQSNNSHSTGDKISQTDSNLTLCHQRTKSNPDQLNDKSLGGKKLNLSESFNDLHFVKKSKGGLAWDVIPSTCQDSCNRSQDSHNICDKSNMEMNNQSYLIDSPDIKLSQKAIISMEDDCVSDQESANLDESGPFKNFSKLIEYNAHLAVFLNYVISNSDPSALLFYLVTNLYKNSCNVKDMKKWAYEIHSCFLVPCAPLRLTNIDVNLVREIDDILQKDSDREEILRKVFWKTRVKAKEELNEQLNDFRHRRTAGLGTLFGPPDFQLEDSIHDKSKELKIIEMILLPNIDPFIDEIEKDNPDDRKLILAISLVTIASKIFGIRITQHNSILERCPTFVSKEKSLKAKLIGKCRKLTMKGHNFVLHQYYTVTYCNHCQLIIWGISPQGYQCTNCLLNIHRACVKVLDENCPGPIIKKDKTNDRISKLMDKIRSEREIRKKPSIVQLDKSKRQSEDNFEIIGSSDKDSEDRTGLTNVHLKSDDSFKSSKRENIENMTHCSKLNPGISINRSESFKDQIYHKRQFRRRKTSDPNLPSKYKNDQETEINFPFSRSNSSSNSNLSSKSLDNHSISLEGIVQNEEISCLYSDSDDEFDLKNWSSNVSTEILDKLSSKEKKRQEIINELYHTEKSHIRGLRVLECVFYRPMKQLQILPPDQLQLLFANLEQMFELHKQFCNSIKSVRKIGYVVQKIGHILINTFDGTPGEIFQNAAATFCARQQIALESLKERRKKDSKLNMFLNDAECNPMCKRLQLKDILPTGMIRLTKYPLLFESLIKCTSDEEELAHIKTSYKRSRVILNHVNQAVREAEDELRLLKIQQKLDLTPFEKVEQPLSEFKNFDVTKHKLIYEGCLWLRISGTRQKMIELHVLLLEDLIVLLNKLDDKYVLKYYGFQDRTPILSPIIKISTALVRHNAVDKKAMFLVNTSQKGAQIYDLVTTSSTERKIWFRHISEATESFKNNESKMKMQVHPVINYDLLNTKKKLVSKNSIDSSLNNNSNNSLLDSSNTSNYSDETNENNKTDNSNNMTVLSKIQKSSLIDPCEVLISKNSVLEAQPVLTHLEKLRINNKIIEDALTERLQLVADILKIPLASINDQNENVSDDPNTILFKTVSQGNEIITVLNESLTMTEADTISSTIGKPKCLYDSYTSHLAQISKVKPIVASLNSQINELLISANKQNYKEENLRKELYLYRERLHAFQEKSIRLSNSEKSESSVETPTKRNLEKNGPSLEV